MVLGADRLNRFPPVDEYDFYNGQYLDENDEPIPITIDLVLSDLSDELRDKIAPHVEFWNAAERRTLDRDELAAADNAQICVQLRAQAIYNAEEDEFEAHTYFLHSPDSIDGELKKVGRGIKRLFGFLYLRTIRTGNRALSLERGSLLDVILRTTNTRAGLWESTLQRLAELNPPIDEGAADLRDILQDIEQRLGEYIPMQGGARKTQLHVSSLTREHLRKTLAFFLKTGEGQSSVPFQRSGTGTLNTLVLALLSYIADIKDGGFIFAMEEPEIALPPHTQRRVANYLLTKSAQCFVTSHSPYVIEMFKPEQIQIIKNAGEGEIEATRVSLESGLKAKTYKQNLRRSYAEAMLSKGVIVGEGITEQFVISHIAQRMELEDMSLQPLDLAGVTVMAADGDTDLLPLGKFLAFLDIPAFAFYDHNPRFTELQLQEIDQQYELVERIGYDSMESLLVDRISLDTQWTFLSLCLLNNDELNAENKFGIPQDRPTDQRVKHLTKGYLKRTKGEGGAVLLLECCTMAQVPHEITNFLTNVYQHFAVAVDPNPIEDADEQDAVCFL